MSKKVFHRAGKIRRVRRIQKESLQGKKGRGLKESKNNRRKRKGGAGQGNHAATQDLPSFEGVKPSLQEETTQVGAPEVSQATFTELAIAAQS